MELTGTAVFYTVTVTSDWSNRLSNIATCSRNTVNVGNE